MPRGHFLHIAHESRELRTHDLDIATIDSRFIIATDFFIAISTAEISTHQSVLTIPVNKIRPATSIIDFLCI